MDEEEKPILVGYLTIKSQNGFSIRIFKKPKYCQLFKASRNGIERLEISDSDNDKNTRIVTLENCVKIVLEQPPTNIINIVTKTGQIQLHSTNEATAKQWKIALQSVAFKENQSSSCVLPQNAVIEEDNDLYCSSYSEGIFTVTLIPTDASVKCGLESKMYTLMLSGTEIQLKCYEDEYNIIAKWPYRFIRKYGYRDGKFTFEAGRKCDTGEGTFKLDNANPQEIFRCMSTKMKSMKKNINNDSFNISTNSMSNTFSSVFSSLEPGSRSPLPPTPQGSFIDGNNQNPFRSVLKSPEVGNKSCIPNKPPRKVVAPVISHQISNKTTPSDQRSHSTNSNVSSVFIKNHHDSHGTIPEVVNCKHHVPLPYNRDYECVEDITEAWKKLGIDDVSHTENMPTEDDELSGFVRERSKSSRELKPKHRHESSTVGESVIVTNPIDDNYDTLDFFRTTHKVSLGYTTVVPITNNNKQSPTLMHQSSSSLDDYEIIGDPSARLTTCRNYSSTLLESFDNNVNQITLAPPDTSACRKADDSYLGYGMIRKPSVQSQNSSSGVCSTSTHLFNHEEPEEIHRLDYATVATYPRSGTTWTQEMVWLICNNLDFQTAHREKLTRRFPFFEFHMFMHDKMKEQFLSENMNMADKQFIEEVSKPAYEILNTMRTRRFIKTHFPISLLPPSIFKTGAKIIYVARNPSDVVVSYYHLNKLYRTQGYVGDFETFYNYFESDLTSWSPYWTHLKQGWKARCLPNVLFMFYENMNKNLPETIRTVANFLQKDLSDEELVKLMDHLSIDKFKNNSSINGDDLKAVGILNNTSQGFIRQGKVNSSEHEMTNKIKDRIRKWTLSNLKDTDLRFPSM